MVAENPFDEFKAQNEVNRARDHFVRLELFNRLMDVTTDPEFRALLALVRIGGVRCPSEVKPLEWSNVHAGANTVTIVSPKLNRYQGKSHRTIPLWPGLAEPLQEWWDRCDDCQPLVFPNHQCSGSAITGKLQRLCRRIGEPLWAKPWQNMRASRETELLESHPIHKVADWMGHSASIALKHYAQIFKEQDAGAASSTSGSVSGSHSGKRRSTNPKHV